MGFTQLLTVSDLRVSVEGKTVVQGFSLEIGPGEVHAIMGPNGSGKSSLVNTLMGHPRYAVERGSATFRGEDLLAMDPATRAAKGLFLAFQYPKEIAGVTLRSFLFAAARAQADARGDASKPLSPVKFTALLQAEMAKLRMDPAFAERSLNQGFSGGEKKKAEVLQMAILKPRLALLDETDSGLDIDALKVVSDGVTRMRSPDFSAVIVTHYARILDHVRPDHVHVMIDGVIRESGGMELAERLEREGYARYGHRDSSSPRLTLDS